MSKLLEPSHQKPKKERKELLNMSTSVAKHHINKPEFCLSLVNLYSI